MSYWLILTICMTIAIFIIVQIGYWIEQISNLYYNKFKSKKDFLISIIPGKVLLDIYNYMVRCFRIFRSLQ